MRRAERKRILRHHKAVFLDAGGTLLRPYPSVGSIYSRTAAHYGANVNPEDIDTVFYRTWNHRNASAALALGTSEKEEKLWWKALVYEVFEAFGGVPNFEAFFEDLYHRFAGKESWRLFDETAEVLEELKKRGHYLAVLSNWDSRLLQICEELGISRYFDALFVSALVGYGKPDPRIFEYACREAGLEPNQAIHIGDSLEDDYYGARLAGLDAVFLDRLGRINRPEVLTIRSLRDLLA